MQTPRAMFSLEHYEMQFDLVLQVPEAKAHFHDYLKSCLNEEGILFLNAVFNFSQEVSDIENQHKIALSILDQFIRVGSPSEVNVDNSARNCVVETTENAKLGVLLPPHTFEPVTKIIYRELKEDAFPRYIRTESFIKFVMKKGEDFVKEIALDLRVSNIKNAVLYQPKDFNQPCITDRDIQFMFKLIEATSDWECVYEAKEHEAYVSKTKYSIGGMKGLKLVKYTGYLPCNLETASTLEMNNNRRHKMDAQLRELLGSKIIIAGDNNQFPYSMVSLRYTLDIGPLFLRRIFDAVFMLGYDTERNCFFNFGKTSTVYSDQMPASIKKNGVSSDLLYGYTFFKVSETRTRYVQVCYTNIHLNLPGSDLMFASIAKTRSVAMHKGYLMAINDKETPDDEMLLELYADFKKRHLPNKDSVKTWTFE